MTGVGLRKDLAYQVLQALLLPVMDAESLRPIVLLDSTERVHVEPSTSLSLVDSVASTTYIYVANPTSGVITGYTLAQSTSEVSFHLKIN